MKNLLSHAFPMGVASLLLALLLAAAPLAAQQPGAPVIPSPEVEPDQVILFSGERLGGVVLALNDQQLILRSPQWGSIHIPRSRIATLALRTTTFDTALYPTPGELRAQPERGPAAARVPAGGRVFSVMPGDAPAPGGFPSAGPLNPLNQAMIVPSDMTAFSRYRLDSGLFLGVRDGHAAVVRELSGGIAVAEGDAWRPLARAGYQFREGARWRVDAGERAEILLRGGTLATLRGPSDVALEAATGPATPEEPARASLTLAGGSLLLDHATGAGLTLALPTMEITGRAARLGIRYDATTGTRLAVFAGEIEARWRGQSAPLRLTSGQGARIDPAGGVLGPSVVGDADLAEFR